MKKPRRKAEERKKIGKKKKTEEKTQHRGFSSQRKRDLIGGDKDPMQDKGRTSKDKKARDSSYKPEPDKADGIFCPNLPTKPQSLVYDDIHR